MLGLDDVEDCITGVLSRRYDLDGLVSKFEDLQYSFEDKEYRWDNTADKMEDIDVEEVAYQYHINGLKSNKLVPNTKS